MQAIPGKCSACLRAAVQPSQLAHLGARIGVRTDWRARARLYAHTHAATCAGARAGPHADQSRAVPSRQTPARRPLDHVEPRTACADRWHTPASVAKGQRVAGHYSCFKCLLAIDGSHFEETRANSRCGSCSTMSKNTYNDARLKAIFFRASGEILSVRPSR